MENDFSMKNTWYLIGIFLRIFYFLSIDKNYYMYIIYTRKIIF